MRGWLATAGILLTIEACGGRTVEPAATALGGAGADAAMGGDASSDARSLEAGGAGDAGCAGTWENGYCTVTLADVPPDAVSDIHWSGGVAVDSRNAYWVSVLPPDCSCNGSFDSVMSVPLGGGAKTTLASGYYEPGDFGSAIAVDSTSVYWTGGDLNQGFWAVWKVPLGGGATTPLASSSSRWAGVGDVAVDGTSVYWIGSDAQGGSAVMKASAGGGAATTLAASNCVYGPLAVDTVNVYWFDCHSLLETPVAGGVTVTLVSSLGVDLAVDSTSVYWTTSDRSGNGSVMKVSIGGGAPVTLASAPGQAWSLAVDSTSVYWLESNANGSISGVMKTPLGGGTSVTIASVQSRSPAGIAVDALGNVYWTVGDALMKTMPLAVGDR